MERILRASFRPMSSWTTKRLATALPEVRPSISSCHGLATLDSCRDLWKAIGHRRRWASTSSTDTTTATASSSKNIASRRLYRILHRQCLEFAKTLPSEEGGEPLFLLQTRLDASKDYGKSRVLPIKTASPVEDDDVRTLLILFRHWNDVDQDVDQWFELVDPKNHKHATKNSHNSKISDQGSDSDADDSDTDDIYDLVDLEPTLWTSVSSIQKTIRVAFRRAHCDDTMDSKEVRRMTNKFAIVALRHLIEQTEMWNLSSVSYEASHHVRVVATSRSLGSSHAAAGRQLSSNETPKYRFVYRIRIENLSDQDSIQLLGRHWRIQEMDCVTGATPVADPVIIDAPTSGAVGQHPVLHPGEAFEYMSGCELFNRKGIQQGSFVLAKVPSSTPSSILGSNPDALLSPDKFQVQVEPFRLDAALEEPIVTT